MRRIAKPMMISRRIRWARMACVIALLGPVMLATAEDGASGLAGGKVTFAGEAPAPLQFAINKDIDVCGHGMRDRADVQVDPSGGLTDVVVYLATEGLTPEWSHPEEGYTLNQEGCYFEPHILVFPNDRSLKLKIVNSDPVLHNVHVYQVIGRSKPTVFNLAQPSGAPPMDKRIRARKGSNVLEVKCDAHDFMQSWIFVAENPYYTTVGEAGAFELTDLPAGEHVVKAWHPYLGTLEKTIEVEPGQRAQVDFEFTSKGEAQ